MLPEQANEPLPAAGADGGEKDPPRLRLLPLDMRAERVEECAMPLPLALGHEITPLPPPGVEPALRFHERRRLHDAAVGEPTLPLLGVEEERFGRNRVVGSFRDHRGRRRGAGAVEIGDRLQAVVARLARAMIEHHGGAGEIVEQRLQAVVEERQPVFEAGMAAAGGDRLVERIAVARAPEPFAIGGAKARDRGRVEQYFADRHQLDRLHLRAAALRHRIEGADGLDRVAGQIEAHRMVFVGREEIDDAAAHGVIARLHHRAGAREAVAFQVIEQGPQVERGAGREGKGRVRQHRARRHPLQRSVDGGEDDARPPVARPQQPDEPGEPPARDVGARRNPVVGKAVPCRNRHPRTAGIEEGEHRGGARETGVVAGDVEQRLRRPRFRQAQQDRGRESLRDAAQHDPARARQGGRERFRDEGRQRRRRAMASRLSRFMKGVSNSAGTVTRPVTQFAMSASLARSSRSAWATSSGAIRSPRRDTNSPSRMSVSLVPVRAAR